MLEQSRFELVDRVEPLRFEKGPHLMSSAVGGEWCEPDCESYVRYCTHQRAYRVEALKNKTNGNKFSS